MEEIGPSLLKRCKTEPSKNKSNCESSITLHNAVLQQDLVLVAQLAASDENINITNELGKTALELAISTKNIAIIKILLKNNASLSKKNSDGFEPLHLAVCERYIPTIALFIYLGANIEAMSFQNMTPLDLAVSRNYIDVAAELISWGASVNVNPRGYYSSLRIAPLKRAIQSEHTSMIRFLLKQGVNINCLSNLGYYFNTCESDLVTAINKNNREIIRLLIRHGANVNLNQPPKFSPLHCAINNCDEDIVKLLLDRCANVNYRYETRDIDHSPVTLRPLDPSDPLKFVFPSMCTPLHVAVYLNKANIVRLLLERGADPNLTDTSRSTPLHYATYRSHEIMNLLLDSGANIDDFQYSVDRPLHVAVTLQDRGMVDLLLSRGSKVNQVTKEQPYKASENCSALIHAVEVGSESLVKLLISKGADVNFQGNNTSALLCAMGKGHDSILELLLEAQADINLQNASGFTALHFAIKRNCMNLVTRFLNMGANVNAKTDNTCICSGFHCSMNRKIRCLRIEELTCCHHNGMTPLHLAVFLRHLSLSRFLIEHGADVNALDCHQMSPLYYAVFRGKEMVELLLQSGANVDSSPKYRPLHRAIKNKDIELTQLLLDHVRGSKQTENTAGRKALEVAVELGHFEIVDILLRKIAETQFPERERYKIMHAAIKCKEVDMVKQMVDEGFGVDAEDQNGRTPLFQAVNHCNHQAVVRLVNCGAEINHVDKNGMTPLLLAVKPRRTVYLTEIVEVLAKRGAELNVQDQNQCTPLHYAVRNRGAEIISILLNSGADIEVENVNLRTPVMECVKQGSHIPIIMFQTVLKMQTLGLKISKKNAVYLQNYLEQQAPFDFSVKEATDMFEKEIEKMKKTMVCLRECEVSIYDVVLNKKCKMNSYLRSEEMKKLVKMKKFEHKFLHYSGIIRGVINRSIESYKFGHERHEVVRKILNEIYVLPFECTEQIASYLCKKDLVHLKTKSH